MILEKQAILFRESSLSKTQTKQDIEEELKSSPWLMIDKLNWESHPVKVEAKVRAVAGSDAFFLEFYVDEPYVRATKSGASSGVCEDSCVEWFVSPNSEDYTNFEFNPIGGHTIQKGPSREPRHNFSQKELPGLLTWGSEGHLPFETKIAERPWSLWAVIPYSLFGMDEHQVKKISWRCNFYKSGDALPNVHYQSLAPIHSSEPDFHRPEYFSALTLIP